VKSEHLTSPKQYNLRTVNNNYNNNTILSINHKSNTNKESDFNGTVSTSKYFPINKIVSNNNLSQKIIKTKYELLNLRTENEFEQDFESRRLINRENLTAFSPKSKNNENNFKRSITDTLGIFLPKNNNNSKDTDMLANRIFKRNKSPLKSEANELLTDTFRKQHKLDLFKERNDIMVNPQRQIFSQKKNELINIIKCKPGDLEFANHKNEINHSHRIIGVGCKLDNFIEKKPTLSLKQMDTNLKYSKIDYCTYYSNKPKIRQNTNLNDFNFTKSKNTISKLIFCLILGLLE